MTFVLAQRFGERVIIVADTMISEDPRKGGYDIIPGALKSLVVNGKLSIAYSGSEVTAVDAIRTLKTSLNSAVNLDNVIAYLKDVVSAHFQSDQQCEFIVVSHLCGLRMFKIWSDGQHTEAKDIGQLWIGHPEPVNEINRLQQADPSISQIEIGFLNAIVKLGHDPVRFRQLGVGGFLIPLLASPIGHTYQGLSSSTAWDVVMPGIPVSQAQLTSRESGMTSYQYEVVSNFYRGVAVAGVYLQQARTGFLYRPMVKCRGQAFRNVSGSEMSKIVSDACCEAGGWIDN